MSDLVDADDLALYFGEEVDEDRAEFLIDQATKLCESYASPLPDAASTVVLSVAARAYFNPTNVSQEGVGPLQFSRPSGSIYLTTAERAALGRMVGRGGAFSTNLLAGYPANKFDES